jgi:hypothetical protein
MAFLDYLSLTEQAEMYGLTALQLNEIRKTAGVLQAIGMAMGFVLGLGVGYNVWH